MASTCTHAANRACTACAAKRWASSALATVVVTTNLDGKLTTLPESPTMDGYTFNGWYTEPVGGSRITTATVFTGDTTIYAQWTAKSSSASPTAPTLPVTGGPALQKHLGTLLVAGILVTLVVVAAV